MRKTVAVDLDGVIAGYDRFRGVDHFGAPIPGAREFLVKVREVATVVIHTARIADGQAKGPAVVAGLVKAWLDQHELPYDEIHVGVGKPLASAYVDDRAVVCRDGKFEEAIQGVLDLVETAK